MLNRKGKTAAAALCALAAAGLFAPASALAKSLAELDRIQDEAGTLENFLGRPEILERYFKASEAYYGAPNFPRPVFDRVIEQMRALAAQSPDLANQMWRKEKLGKDFEVKLGAPQVRLELQQERWAKLLEEKKAELREQAAKYAGIADPNARDQALRAALEDFDRQIKGAGANGQEVMAKLMADERMRGAFAWLALAQLDSEAIDQSLRASDAEGVFSTLDRLRRPKELDWSAILPNPPESVKSMAQYIPNPKALRGNKDLVKSVEVSDGAFKFVAPRRLHAIFRGFSAHECTAGLLKTIDWTTPRRWAIPLLDGSQVHFVEADAKLDGFVQYVPMQNKDGAKVMSVDLQSPALRQTIQSTDPKFRGLQRMTLYEAWLRRVPEHLPPGFVGVGVTGSMAANNAAMVPHVQGSLQHKLSINLGSASNFGVVDGARAKQISELSIPLEKEHKYGKWLTFDGIHSGDMRVLNTEILSRANLPYAEIERMWVDGRYDRAVILEHADAAASRKLAKAHTETFLATMLGKDHKFSAADVASLRKLYAGEELALAELIRIFQTPASVVDVNVLSFLIERGGAGVPEIANALREKLAVTKNARLIEEIADHFFARLPADGLKSPQAYLDLFTELRGYAGRKNAAEFSLAVQKRIEPFLRLNPTRDQVIAFREGVLARSEERLELVEGALKRARSAADFRAIAVVTNEKGESVAVDSAVQGAFAEYRALKPDLGEILRLEKLLKEMDSFELTVAARLELAKNFGDLWAIAKRKEPYQYSAAVEMVFTKRFDAIAALNLADSELAKLSRLLENSTFERSSLAYRINRASGKTAAEFIDQLGAAGNDYSVRSAREAFLKRNFEALVRRSPTDKEWREVAKLVEDPDLLASILGERMKLAKALSAKDWLGVMASGGNDYYHRSARDKYGTAHWQDFLALKPTPAEIDRFEKLTEAYSLTISHRISLAKSAREFEAALAAGTSDDFTYRHAREKVFAAQFGRLREMGAKPEDYARLKRYATNSELLQAVTQAAIPAKAKRAAEYLAQLPKGGTSEAQSARDRMIEASVGEFAELSPSEKEWRKLQGLCAYTDCHAAVLQRRLALESGIAGWTRLLEESNESFFGFARTRIVTQKFGGFLALGPKESDIERLHKLDLDSAAHGVLLNARLKIAAPKTPEEFLRVLAKRSGSSYGFALSTAIATRAEEFLALEPTPEQRLAFLNRIEASTDFTAAANAMYRRYGGWGPVWQVLMDRRLTSGEYNQSTVVHALTHTPGVRPERREIEWILERFHFQYSGQRKDILRELLKRTDGPDYVRMLARVFREDDTEKNLVRDFVRRNPQFDPDAPRVRVQAAASSSAAANPAGGAEPKYQGSNWVVGACRKSAEAFAKIFRIRKPGTTP